MMKYRKNAGFTLAEMLIVVAIVIVLMGVAFVGVQAHQRSMTRLEFDSIAKEIFFAAQNHLTEAQSQGYLSENISYGEKGTLVEGDPTDAEIYYLVYNRTNNKGSEIKNLVLPRYAITVGGSFIIRYQPSSAKVLDVFYSLDGKSSLLTVSGTELGNGLFTYENLMNACRGDDKISTRQNYNGAVVGWYGDEPAVEQGKRLKAPTFEVINEKTLHVEISDDPDNASIAPVVKLIVTGKTSGAEAYFLLRRAAENENSRVTANIDGSYSVLLDSITESGKHFAEIAPDNSNKKFYPGEDITVKVVAYSTNSLANVAMSAEKITNSLFADPYPYKADEVVHGSSISDNVVGIANCRHLENLDGAVSKLGENSTGDDALKISKAFQTDDLDWTGYNKAFPLTGTTNAYWPVTPSYSSNGTIKEFNLLYDGQNHSVSNVKVDHNGNAGLFGALNEVNENDSKLTSEIKNLELIDFEITSTDDNAGALVGTATGATITNVVAYHTDKIDAYKTPTISSSSGNAGGLIGSTNNCTVSKSAAALVVKASADAGGLIGASTGGTVTACYSGGHTYSGAPKYDGIEPPTARNSNNAYPARYYDANNEPMYNVIGTVAGGLIGNAGSTTISNSYSTCSASGTTAGGFVGTSSGTITNCYCTGLVPHTETGTVGAFAASLSGTPTGCHYFEIVNEIRNTDAGSKLTSGYHYLTPLPKVGESADAGKHSGITSFDADFATYSSFIPTEWKEAKVYDSVLGTYYQNKYNLQTVEQLSGGSLKEDENDKTEYFVTTHYGDWPAPEEFIFN